MFKSCSGDKIVDQIAVAKSTSSQTVPANAFRTATSTKDNARRYFIFINDCELGTPDFAPRYTTGTYIVICCLIARPSLAGAATSGFAADCDTNANPGNAAVRACTLFPRPPSSTSQHFLPHCPSELTQSAPMCAWLRRRT